MTELTEGQRETLTIAGKAVTNVDTAHPTEVSMMLLRESLKEVLQIVESVTN